MATDVAQSTRAAPYAGASPSEAPAQRWGPWPVNWSGVWIGALAAVAAVLVFGLIGVAVGAQVIDPEARVVELTGRGLDETVPDKERLGWLALAFSLVTAFLAFVIGGWASGRVAGVYRAETGMLHGAACWLVALPALVVLASLGAGSFAGGWYGGLASRPSGASDSPYREPWKPGDKATEREQEQYQDALKKYRANVDNWRDAKKTARATRNAALTAITALLLGLVGSVLGGWMASGEPMSLTYKRANDDYDAPVRV